MTKRETIDELHAEIKELKAEIKRLEALARAHHATLSELEGLRKLKQENDWRFERGLPPAY